MGTPEERRLREWRDRMNVSDSSDRPCGPCHGSGLVPNVVDCPNRRCGAIIASAMYGRATKEHGIKLRRGYVSDYEKCGTCNGAGEIFKEPLKCWECEGTG